MAQVKEVTIDREACQGVGSCVITSEGAFEIDAEGKAVLAAPLAELDADKVIAGARSCSFVAITTVE